MLINALALARALLLNALVLTRAMLINTLALARVLLTNAQAPQPGPCRPTPRPHWPGPCSSLPCLSQPRSNPATHQWCPAHTTWATHARTMDQPRLGRQANLKTHACKHEAYAVSHPGHPWATDSMRP
ncbi:hypothetical protein I3843_12G119200 [Carya illinoinensis]|nr:hypothetical protein I3843_12G119200 [Carya illinoinensis]